MFKEIGLSVATGKSSADVPKNQQQLSSSIHIWDIQTNTLLSTLNDNQSSHFTLCPIPETGTTLSACLVLAYQTKKMAIHVWHFQSDNPFLKFSTPEEISALMCSNDGLYCIGGGHSGRLYIWDMTTGNRVCMLEAHYKRVSLLRMTIDNKCLVTAGEDALIHVWSWSELLSTPQPSPLHTIQGHHLPLSDMAIGYTPYRTARLFTVSRDKMLKVFSVCTGQLLCSILFPRMITALQVDASEHVAYVGLVDGSIYYVDLYKEKNREYYALVDSHTSTTLVQEADTSDAYLFKGHGGTITSLCLSFDGSMLVSSCQDGACIVWDTKSRQSLRVYQQHAAPVTQVSVILKPPHYQQSHSSSNDYLTLIQPFKKFSETQDQDGLAIKLGKSFPWSGEKHLEKTLESSCQDRIRMHLAHSHHRLYTENKQECNDMEVLQETVMDLYTIKKKLETANRDLYTACVEEFISSRKKD